MFTGERMLQCPSRPVVMDRRWKSTSEIAPNCPRCASPNTKFCYYNNYSLSQPRYFCKACRRYWTKGGSLRNVPVGGGCRKNRRSTKSSTGVSPATDSVSLTFCSNNGGIGNPMVVPHPPTTASSNTTATDSDTPNIDLALMFAKFLNPNQNSCFDPGLPAELQSHDQVVEVHSSFSLMGSSSDLMSYESLIPIQFPEEQVVLQQRQQQEQHGMHLIGSDVMLAHDQEVQFTEGCEFGFREQSCRTPQFMDSSSDPNCYDLETILSDEYGQGMALWSENIPAAAVLPNFSWQTQGLQESVVPSPADHHFPYHSNVLFNDNWSSFDLSSCGVFSSRP